MIIDANMHWLPENMFADEALFHSFVHAVPREYGTNVHIAAVPGKNLKQIVIEKPRGYEVLNYAENQYSSVDQIKDMDAAGIDKALLRLPCWQEWIDLETCKKVNDLISQHLARHPGRFLALAIVPPWGTKEDIKELERCIKDLGFCGVQMAAHYGTLYLDEEEFRPYFKVINQLGVPVVVHHTPISVDNSSILKYTNLRRQYGRCIDQATAVGRELFSNMFDQFPNVKLVHSMLGGGFFAFTNMLAPPIKAGRDEIDRFSAESGKINDYLRNNIFFDVSGAVQWGKAQLECAVKAFGADHILYGSSYPIRKDWFMQGVDYVKNLDITEKDKSLILSGNAVRLFDIK